MNSTQTASFQITNSITHLFNSLDKLSNVKKEKYGPELMSLIENALNNVEQKIRVCTYNAFLYDGDDSNFTPEHQTELRIPRVIQAIQEMNPDILAVQGCFEKQLAPVILALSNEYSFYGDKLHSGNAEINGFFYKRDRFVAIKKETARTMHDEELATECEVFYHTYSKIQFKDLKTSKIFDVFNTHLSFSKPDLRQRQATQVSALLSKDVPTIFCGSFNTFPNNPQHPYPLYDGDHILSIFKKAHVDNASEMALLGNIGSLGTFTNDHNAPIPAPFEGAGSPGVNLDHIFLNSHFTVLKRAVNPIKVDGFYPSEHQPVLVDLLIS